MEGINNLFKFQNYSLFSVIVDFVLLLSLQAKFFLCARVYKLMSVCLVDKHKKTTQQNKKPEQMFRKANKKEVWCGSFYESLQMYGVLIESLEVVSVFLWSQVACVG